MHFDNRIGKTILGGLIKILIVIIFMSIVIQSGFDMIMKNNPVINNVKSLNEWNNWDDFKEKYLN